jgi:hypothetical protein
LGYLLRLFCSSFPRKRESILIFVLEMQSFHSPCGRAAYFWHCPKVGKRLGAGRGAPPRIMRGGVLLRFSPSRGRSDGTVPVPLRDRGDPSPRPFGLIPRRLRCSAPLTAPRSTNPCIPALPRCVKVESFGFGSGSGCCSSFCGRMPPNGPLRRGEGAQDKSAGGRTGCAPVR